MQHGHFPLPAPLQQPQSLKIRVLTGAGYAGLRSVDLRWGVGTHPSPILPEWEVRKSWARGPLYKVYDRLRVRLKKLSLSEGIIVVVVFGALVVRCVIGGFVGVVVVQGCLGRTR
jgi:hypothetical protein